MKTIQATLSDEIDTLKIEVFADLHIGDAHCDMRLIRDRLMSVQDDKEMCIRDSYMGAVAVLGVFGGVEVEKWRLRLYASKTGAYG